MLILFIRTDKPEAELGLYGGDGTEQLAYKTWLAHRTLAETIYDEIGHLLKVGSVSWPDLGGIVCYKGPGSFTGLRIGLSVGNALAYAGNLPIVATTGDDWINDGIKRLQSGQTDKLALPQYGASAKATPYFT